MLNTAIFRGINPGFATLRVEILTTKQPQNCASRNQQDVNDQLDVCRASPCSVYQHFQEARPNISPNKQPQILSVFFILSTLITVPFPWWKTIILHMIQ